MHKEQAAQRHGAHTTHIGPDKSRCTHGERKVHSTLLHVPCKRTVGDAITTLAATVIRPLPWPPSRPTCNARPGAPGSVNSLVCGRGGLLVAAGQQRLPAERWSAAQHTSSPSKPPCQLPLCMWTAQVQSLAARNQPTPTHASATTQAVHKTSSSRRDLAISCKAVP